MSITVSRKFRWFGWINFEEMFEEFQKEVLDAYLKMKDGHELPIELENLTRSKLKRYALRVLSHRYNRKDDLEIRQFFDSGNRYNDHERSIRHFELDKFRPLINFLKGDVQNTDERNIKILAWLIDFEPRPYENWRENRYPRQPNNESQETSNDENEHEEQDENIPGSKEKKETATDETGDGIIEPPPPPPPPSKGCQLNVYITIAMVMLMCLGTFLLTYKLRKQCMYWKEDRYVSIHCNEKLDGIEIIPIDRVVVKKFRRITQPDTLTLNAVGKVWYSKPTVDSVEFYTMKGAYPMDRRKELKPATAYIIKKYVIDKQKRE